MRRVTVETMRSGITRPSDAFLLTNESFSSGDWAENGEEAFQKIIASVHAMMRSIPTKLRESTEHKFTSARQSSTCDLLSLRVARSRNTCETFDILLHIVATTKMEHDAKNKKKGAMREESPHI
mmetsp:Transcript_15158/g.31253  ORF Transcript_15158/g.31253 Transcript_15158/m.31253 type:complete len:124 (+) Transcript_15158:1174-1545(+)